ncbi:MULTISPECIES: AAA family ATPase [Nostoc]|uniref:MoxR family ATPase n=2 Tax=Nostoc TaxID=1177 RepID=A0ABR8IBQ7_9NOSO|nr:MULTISPECIES: MoxR family ATPase [Nostoc]MBD2560314.1 MoxR family ATPase [Nostoc linckia FACHB-391]MBD2648704.1 MoxR family ATPase [Nostoc foliaceum FACHB-393]
MVKAVGRQLLEYTGKIQPQLGERGANGQLLYPYLPNPELVEAVNLAIYLERPLLLKGEPGCGKTQLASAVAYELGLNLEAWYVKSTSRAKDGLYNYDAVGRLRDAQLAASGRLTEEQIQRIDDPITYVRWGPLGRAFQQENRTVALIDEIDKADIDFPNDLLLELDQKRFSIEETGQEIEAKAAPIVLITSNDEKDLPDAFLRRCLFHYVEFPSPEKLIQIMNTLFPTASEVLINQAVKRFLELREDMGKTKGEAGKKVSTSELIDWFRVLQRYPQDEVMKKLNGKIPYAGVLLKSWDDHIRYLKQSRGRE